MIIQYISLLVLGALVPDFQSKEAGLRTSCLLQEEALENYRENHWMERAILDGLEGIQFLQNLAGYVVTYEEPSTEACTEERNFLSSLARLQEDLQEGLLQSCIVALGTLLITAAIVFLYFQFRNQKRNSPSKLEGAEIKESETAEETSAITLPEAEETLVRKLPERDETPATTLEEAQEIIVCKLGEFEKTPVAKLEGDPQKTGTQLPKEQLKQNFDFCPSWCLTSELPQKSSPCAPSDGGKEQINVEKSPNKEEVEDKEEDKAIKEAEVKENIFVVKPVVIDTTFNSFRPGWGKPTNGNFRPILRCNEELERRSS